mgnify:CR=1 FL=1
MATAAESLWIEAEHLDCMRGYCWPMGKPEMMVTAAHDKFDPNGALTDEKTREKLGEFLEAFGGWIKRLSE